MSVLLACDTAFVKMDTSGVEAVILQHLDLLTNSRISVGLLIAFGFLSSLATNTKPVGQIMRSAQPLTEHISCWELVN